MSEFYPRNFALARIQEMKRNPEMWAWTEEGLILQLALLLEFAGTDGQVIQKWIGQHGHSMNDNIKAGQRAEFLCDTALEIFPT